MDCLRMCWTLAFLRLAARRVRLEFVTSTVQTRSPLVSTRETSGVLVPLALHAADLPYVMPATPGGNLFLSVSRRLPYAKVIVLCRRHEGYSLKRALKRML